MRSVKTKLGLGISDVDKIIGECKEAVDKIIKQGKQLKEQE